MYTRHFEEMNRIIDLDQLNKEFTGNLNGRDFDSLTEKERHEIYVYKTLVRNEESIKRSYNLWNGIDSERFDYGTEFTLGNKEDGYPEHLWGVILFLHLDVKEFGWAVALKVVSNLLTLEVEDVPLSVQKVLKLNKDIDSDYDQDCDDGFYD